MQFAMEIFILLQFSDFCRNKLWQKVLCNGAQVIRLESMHICKVWVNWDKMMTRFCNTTFAAQYKIFKFISRLLIR